jgi:hypothetical protein
MSPEGGRSGPRAVPLKAWKRYEWDLVGRGNPHRKGFLTPHALESRETLRKVAVGKPNLPSGQGGRDGGG